MPSSGLIVYLILLLMVSTVLGMHLRRLYRAIRQQEGLSGREQTVLVGQVTAMAAYLPLHLAAIALPLADSWRGGGTLLAGLLLAFIGGSAIRNRLFVAFNCNAFRPSVAITGGTAITAGGFMLIVAAIVLYLGVSWFR